MSMGSILKQLRESKGLLQKDVADKIGIYPNAISRYELDKTTPSMETLFILPISEFSESGYARILGVCEAVTIRF